MLTNTSRKILSGMFALLASVLFSISAFGQVDQAPTRDQIDDKYKWDLADYFVSDEAWEAEIVKVEAMIPEIEKFKGQLGSSAETLLACFKTKDTLGMLIHRLWVYSGLKKHEDNRIGKYQEMYVRAYTLYSKLGGLAAYIEPELLTIPHEKINEFLSQNKELAVYKFYFDDLYRRQAHVLSEKEERILSLSGRATSQPQNVFEVLDDGDVKFGNVIDEDGKEVELTRGRYSRMTESKNRDVRRNAYEVFNSSYEKYINVMGANMAASVNCDWYLAEARGYNSCLEYSLNADNIPTSVFHNIIESANKNLAPLHKYTTIRKKALGVDTLFPFDMNVPLVENIDTEFPYEKAQDLVYKALKPLGKEYQERVKVVYDSRWIDVFENQGKYSGGYNWGAYLAHPVILLNWANSMDDMFTLAHEVGHALHAYYTNRHEPFTYTGHSLFTAEVASTCNEALMIDYMLKNAKSREEKLYILNYYINMFSGTYYTQLYFSEYELKMHEVIEQGGALSAENLRQMYREVYEKYFGPDYFLPEGRDLGGLRIGHFYRQYYVYQYATGFAAAQMLAKMILEGKPEAKEAYMEFIKTGTSDYPINILKKAGIDFTTTEPYDNVARLFNDLVTQYEKLLFEK